MAASAFLLIASFMLVLLLLSKPLGNFIAQLIEGQPVAFLQGFERGILRTAGSAETEMNWWQYALAIMVFNILGIVVLMALLMAQGSLPLNPQNFGGLSWDLAFNTAISFVSNTNWQAYSGESTLSYLSQMVGLTVQNFLSAATGIAVAFALIRAFARPSAQTIGNAWTDLWRITIYLLIPIALLIAVFFVSQGVLQNFEAYQHVTTLEGLQQTLPMGPVASQEAIKMLGTNGGGFFGANSAHPFENPTALSNMVQMLAIFLIPCALCFAFGRVVGDNRQGHALIWSMSIIFVVSVVVIMYAELQGNPHFTQLGANSNINMEGKESRFGILASSFFAAVTTAASCGAVNAMHDSFTALGGMIPLINIQLGEIIVGGVGAGMYGMLLFVIISIFVAGLMVGRTPEYVGKKIEAKEVKMAMLAILVLPLMYLGWTAVAAINPQALPQLGNAGPHGFSEMLYLYVSSTANNGSAFGGITANTMFFNITGAVAMFVGRFFMIVPAMAIAGSLAEKKSIAASAGTFPTTGGLFIGLVVGVILIVGGLTFFPALALGPIVEHLAMQANTLF